MSTLECPRCGVRWDKSWSRLCWVCGTLGEPSRRGTPDVGWVVRELRRLGLGAWVSSIENDVTIEVRGGPWGREVRIMHDVTEESWLLMPYIDGKPVFSVAGVPLEAVPRSSLILLEMKP